jgi:hypothetical protein
VVGLASQRKNLATLMEMKPYGDETKYCLPTILKTSIASIISGLNSTIHKVETTFRIKIALQ